MRAARHAKLLGLVLSGLGHVLAWLLLAPAARFVPRPTSDDTQPFEFEILSRQVGAPSLEPIAQPTRPAPARQRPSTDSRVAQKPPIAEAPAEPMPFEVEVAEAPSPAAPAPNSKDAPIDLSPLAASQTIFDVRAAQTATEGPRAAKTQVDPTARLNDYLARVAHSKPWVSRSDDPELTRNADGSLSHDGNGFNATIDADGRVHFDDKYVDFELTFKPVIAADGTVTFTFFKAVFAIDTWLEKQFGKGDPYRSERRWFLERTAQLREARIQRHWQRVAKAGATALRHRLQDIWNDASLDLRAQKAATFAHWDECADDEIGALGREIVETFVRERCPQGSDCAFLDADLVALNGTRKSKRSFAPYEASKEVRASESRN